MKDKFYYSQTISASSAVEAQVMLQTFMTNLNKNSDGSDKMPAEMALVTSIEYHYDGFRSRYVIKMEAPGYIPSNLYKLLVPIGSDLTDYKKAKYWKGMCLALSIGLAISLIVMYVAAYHAWLK